MRLDSPVRLAPEAPVIRWTTRPAPRLAEAPTLALDWAADVSLRVARLALSRPSAHPMVPVFCAFAPATNRQAGRAPAGRRSTGQGHAAEGGATVPGRRLPGRLARPGPDRGASMHLNGGELLNVSPGRTREPDEACAQAVDLARSAAEEMAGAAAVGEHLGVEADGERVV